MQVLLAACRELAGDQNRLPKVLYVFYHKTWCILIHAPYSTYCGILIYQSYTPKDFIVKFVIIPSCFIYIVAAISVKYAQQVQLAVGCSDLWGDIHYLGCSVENDRETGLLLYLRYVNLCSSAIYHADINYCFQWFNPLYTCILLLKYLPFHFKGRMWSSS